MTALKAALRRWYFALPFFLCAFVYFLLCLRELTALFTVFSIPTPFAASLSVLFLLSAPTFVLLEGLFDRLHNRRAATVSQQCFSALALPYLYTLIFLGLQSLYRPLVSDLLAAALTLTLLVLLHGIAIPMAYRIRLRYYRGQRKKSGALSLSRQPRSHLQKTAATSHLRVVFTSDLHLGFFTAKSFLRKTVDTLVQNGGDILLLSGDLFDRDYRSLRHPAFVEAQLLRLKEAFPLGIYLCEGNHDRGALRKDPKIAALLSRIGMNPLFDESVLLEKDGKTILLSGSCDSYPVFGLPTPLAPETFLPHISPPQDTLHLHLKHRPDKKELVALSQTEHPPHLILCGHTHGGVTFPGNLIYRLSTPYHYGLHTCGNSLCYTSSGCGFSGMPMRLFVKNEITLIDLPLS